MILNSKILISSIPWARGSLRHHGWFRNQFPPFFPVFHCPLWLGELQACPFPDVVFPPLPLSALSSSPFSLCLARWFCSDLINGRHDHTTAVWSCLTFTSKIKKHIKCRLLAARLQRRHWTSFTWRDWNKCIHQSKYNLNHRRHHRYHYRPLSL